MYYSQKIKMVLLKGMLFLCSPFYRMRHPVPEEKRKRVIVIRNDALGDFIVFLYSAFALRKALPRSEYCITLFVTSNNVKWAEKSDLFDEVFSIRRVACKQSFPQVMDQFLLFHSLRADVLVNALHGRDGDSDLPAFASRAKRKYAFSLSEWQHPDCEKIKFYERVYTETLPLPMEKSLIDSTCSLFQMALQCPIVPSPLPAAQVGFLKDLSYPVDNLPHPYCVLVPGSNSKRRNWSAENFIETVQMLKKNFPDLHFIVTGGPSENDLCRKIALSVQAVDLCGKLDLSELASVQHHADFCISNDTGPAHLASVFGVRTFCILSGQHFGLYAPCPYRPNLIPIFHRKDCFSCNGRCFDPDPEKPFPCIAEITPDEVVQVIRKHCR